MRNHRNRLDKLAARLGPGEEDEDIIIRLMWGDEPMPGPPITYRRGDDVSFTQVIAALHRDGYTGGKVTVRWVDEGEG